MKQTKRNPPRLSRPWTAADEEKLVLLFKAGSNLLDISYALQMPERAIGKRVKKLGLTRNKNAVGKRDTVRSKAAREKQAAEGRLHREESEVQRLANREPRPFVLWASAMLSLAQKT